MGNIISNLLQNVSNLSNGVSNTLMNTVPVVSSIDNYNLQRNSIFYPFGFGPYWGPWCGPWGGCLPPIMYPQDYIYTQPQYIVQPQQYVTQPQYTPQTSIYSSPSFSGATNYYQNMDMLLNPQCYTAAANPFAATIPATTTETKPTNEQPTEAVSNYDAQGNDTTPNWYTELKSKQQAGKALTANEKQLIANYEKLSKKYSIYATDANGNMIQQANGQYKMSALVGDIHKIESLANGWGSNSDAIARVIKGMSPEKLAALEHYYPQVTGKQLREVIKDSAAWWGTRWLGINYSSSNELLDYIDKTVATTNPSNMAKALYQALNNHRIWGLGVDDERIMKLLTKIASNKELLAAVQEEYSQNTGSRAVDLITDINDKWFISSEDKAKMINILSQAK